MPSRKPAPPERDVRRVLDAFRNLVKALRIADRAGVKEYGLGSAQIFVLHQLVERSPLSINELAALTATDQSSVSVVVSKLVTKGLITIGRSEEDARRNDVTLTAKGKQILKRIPPPFQTSFIEALDGLAPAEVTTLGELLERLAFAMGADDEHPPMLFEEAPKRRPRK
ncbi:MAG TPA: MarR family winged helix-turn-helix transcriptional regulator [Thermoanaerobaculia bacterium]|nr:MarR family winged helix-turn-helix transcriptional regulator [Thermoanaerobaculia bacterium]